MILKILLLVAVIGIVYFIFFKKKPNKMIEDSSDEKKAHDMIECANCGVYSEIDDSILSNAKYYCSSECLKEVK